VRPKACRDIKHHDQCHDDCSKDNGQGWLQGLHGISEVDGLSLVNEVRSCRQEVFQEAGEDVTTWKALEAGIGLTPETG
jgi:hypothetical protein